MNSKGILEHTRIDTPLKLTVGYALLGSLWILGCDWISPWWTGIHRDFQLYATFKDLLFIGVTSGLLYALTRRLIRKEQQVAAALRDTEMRWQFALRGVGDGMWDWDATTNRVFYSDRWKEMLGYAGDEIGDSLDEWKSRVHPDDLPGVLVMIEDHVAGRTPMYVSEHRLRRKDGSWLWVLDRGQLLSRTPDGRPLRLVGTQHDITEAKTAKKELANTLNFLEALIHSSPIGIIAYRLDGDAMLANEAAARIVGAEVSMLLKQNFRNIESWRESGLLAAAVEALASGQTVAHEGPMVTTFGRSIRFAAQLVPFEHGGGRHLLLLIRDVTERMKNEEMLQTLRSALEATPSGIVLTDPEGNIEWVNPAFTKLTGYSREEAVGHYPRILKSNRHPREFYARFWETISRGEIWQGEITNCRKDGSLYHEHMTVAPIRNGGGHIVHFVAIKNDISAMKTLEQQLARTQRLEGIGLLASGIAHDLNNIFAPILLSIELLKFKYPAADARKTLEMIESAGKRGAGIVKQVLTFARGAEGEHVELQARYLLKELTQLLHETLPRNIELRHEQAVRSGLVRGDATQLHQVLLNLAINARDAMPDGGVLTLGLDVIEVDEDRRQRHPSLRPGPHVAMSVADTGTGIPPAVLDRMFEPFFTTKPRGNGTGLGLSTVYGIVRSHGGVVDVCTELGRGSKFTVLLPAVQETVEKPASNPPIEATVFRGHGRRILVVDDEETIRLVTMHTLQRHGFVIELAVDGADAWDLIRPEPDRFAAVLTDLMMPHMNGVEAIRQIRSIAPHLPVIASSGLSGDGPAASSKLALKALGVRTLLRKPYTEQELLDALQRELEPTVPLLTPPAASGRLVDATGLEPVTPCV